MHFFVLKMSRKSLLVSIFNKLERISIAYTVKNVHVKATAFIAGNCVLCCFNSGFTQKINKTTYKSDKNVNIFVVLLVLFVNSLLKQQSIQLSAMKAVI
jgi:hypothetical protein